jgi:2-dehydropantoate 2-reductase
MAERAMAEVVAVATARGVKLDDDVIGRTMQRYDALAPDATSSLQRDVMSEKPSELDAQLGAAVRLGRDSGVLTPVMEMLYDALLPQEQIARQSVNAAGIRR